jgi:subtilisin family serine protease
LNIKPQGVVVVAAAGNTGDSTPIYPAAEQADNLVAVAASTSDDALASFSTRGDWIDIMAPGERIVSPIPNGRFATWRGTSFSAPIVSGVTALVMVQHPNMDPNQIADHVKGTAADIIGANFLRVDAGRALTITHVPH